MRDTRFMGVLDAVLEAGAGLYDDPADRAWVGLPDDWPPRGRGLPIGALTSQLFAAQVVLNELDHVVKRQLKVPGYVRYVDDLFLFGRGRGELRRWRAAVVAWVREERDLRVKHPSARILSCAGHLDALGYRITRTDRRALGKVKRRMQARIREAATRRPGQAPQVALEQSLASSIGVMLF
ncbi:MAG: RNA-directed DNA polymerase [Alphaproteobacteria bacterium]|nr:RNA-directed DNA polymerase [Alphaproteobacteria bacterium]